MTVYAEDRWVILGQARGPAGDCRPFHTWQAAVVAHNVSSEDAVVRVVETSNGVTPAVQTAGVPAGASVQLPPLDPLGAVPVFIGRLDVPPSIRLESRLEYRYENPCVGAPPAPGPAGKIALPVFTALHPAGEAQTHFGTDLGLQNVRVNVGIYNGGEIPLTATVEIRRPACAAGTSTLAEVRVAARELVQVTLPPAASCGGGNGLVPHHVTYAIVTADQPSLSYVTPVSNDQGPVISFGVAAR